MLYRLVQATLVCIFCPVLAAAQTDPPADEDMSRPRVAIVMGGGGAHGVAHLGVLQELERQHVPIDLIVGSGYGALVGGLYASGMSVDEISKFVLDTDWQNVFNPDTRREDLSFRRKADDEDFLIKYRVGMQDGQAQLPTALIPNGKLAQLLQSTVASSKGISDFDDLPVPYRAVAMDLENGDQVVLKTGALDRAMLATLSAPGTLPPVPIGERQLVSGGLINNLPVGVARSWGADIVIVVDIGIYVHAEDDLNSIFSIVDQVSQLMQHRNSEGTIATIGSSDVLIKPDVAPRKLNDVGDAAIEINAGVAAVAAQADRFDTVRLGAQEFAALNQERIERRELVPVISAIELENNSIVDDSLVLAQISQSLNAPLDKEALESDLRAVYGLGEFSAVEFSLDDLGETSVLHLRMVEKRGGNRFWRFGISLQDDLEGNSAYTASASVTWTSLNKLGGEWRTVARIGEVQQLTTEWYQPLTKSGRYFASVNGGFLDENVNTFLNGEIIGQARVEQLVGQLQVGRIFGNSGQVTAGLIQGSGKTESNIGSDLPEGEFDVGGYTASAEYDTYDNVYFPKQGARAKLGWVGQRESAGASFDVDVLEGGLGIAKSFGDNTLIGGLSLQSQLNDVAGVQNLLSTGGLFNLSGFQRDELTGRHTAVARGVFYHSLRTNPLRGFLEAALYAGVSLEVGNAWQTSDDVSLSNTLLAGSLFLGADTFIGPVYLAGGLAEGGHTALYLFVGKPF